MIKTDVEPEKIQIEMQIEIQLALHGAPVLTGLKVSNLLIIPHQWQGWISRLAEEARLQLCQLYIGGQKTVLLLYHRRQLERYLMQPQTLSMLRRMGYRDISFAGLVGRLSGKYTDYMHGKGRFPHEMGLFLGYPAADVRGFIENKGKNFLYAGYWKVYENMEEKLQLFQAFDRAKESLICLLADGMRMQEILQNRAANMVIL